MLSGDVKLELVLLNKLAGAILTLGWLLTRVLETENRGPSDFQHFSTPLVPPSNQQ